MGSPLAERPGTEPEADRSDAAPSAPAAPIGGAGGAGGADVDPNPAGGDGATRTGGDEVPIPSVGKDQTVAPFRPVVVNTGKPAVVIVFDIDRYQAEILGHGPTPITPDLFDPVKADLWYYFQNHQGEILKFGRAKRDPTAAQRLAIEVRDRHCIYPHCRAPASRCHVHHLNEWLRDNGHTDVEVLGLFCGTHHRHLHRQQLTGQRERDGTVSIRIHATGELVATATPFH